MSYSGIYVVFGPPGTGKTRFCAAQVDKVCKTVPRSDPDAAPVAVCSLTRAAAREIASRDLPIPEYQVGTLHSMAYRQIGSPPIAEVEVASFNEMHPAFAVDAKPDVDDLNSDDFAGKDDTQGSELYQQHSLYRATMTPHDLWTPEVKYFAKIWEEWKQKEGLVDFSDMIDMAVAQGHGHAPGNPRVIVVDEAQDISIQEWQLLRVWYEAADAMIVAGDPNQSLFRWRGADHSIFFDPAIPDTHKKVLHQSYRVPRAVRDLSMQWLREQLSGYVEIDYRPRPEEGTLGMLDADIKQPGAVVEWVDRVLRDTDETVMIEASCGYMLRDTIAMLRSEGIPFANPWRRKRTDWNPLGAPGKKRPTHFKLLTFYRFLTNQQKMTFGDTNAVLGILRQGEVLKHGAKAFFKQMASEVGKSAVDACDVQNAFEPQAWAEVTAAVAAEDAGRTFATWMKAHASGQSGKAMEYASAVVKRCGFDGLIQPPRCYIGTCHSLKGSQSDNVIIYPELSYAADVGYAYNKGPDEHNDVVRTFYVGMTRARRTLTVCRPKSRMFVDIPLTPG